MRVFRFALTIIIVARSDHDAKFFRRSALALFAEWEKTVEAAKKEGKLVAAIPASAELRKAIGEIFPKRFPASSLTSPTRVGHPMPTRSPPSTPPACATLIC